MQIFRDMVGPFLTVGKSEFDVTSLYFGKEVAYSFVATLARKPTVLCFRSWNVSELASPFSLEGFCRFLLRHDGWHRGLQITCP